MPRAGRQGKRCDSGQMPWPAGHKPDCFTRLFRLICHSHQMSIPDLNEQGFLPPGIHTCTLEEVKSRFGSFRVSDRRPKLFAALLDLMTELRRTDLFEAVILDGSFVTESSEPNDIDLILALKRSHDWKRDPAMHEYNVLSRSRLRRRFGFDVFLAVDGDFDYVEMVEFFAGVRDNPDVRKGMLRIKP